MTENRKVRESKFPRTKTLNIEMARSRDAQGKKWPMVKNQKVEKNIESKMKKVEITKNWKVQSLKLHIKRPKVKMTFCEMPQGRKNIGSKCPKVEMT